MSGVNNAAEDDQVTVRPRSLACESYAPPISASVATPAKPWHDAAGAAGPRACRTLDAAIGRAWFTMAHASSRATVRSALPSFALGAATGLLCAPCAGPVLGLVLTTAALQGPSTQTTLLHVAYAAGPSRAPTRSGRTRSTDQLPLPASSRAACSRCRKAARPTENNRGTPSG